MQQCPTVTTATDVSVSSNHEIAVYDARADFVQTDITIGSLEFWCKTCKREYGVSQSLCQQCFDAETEHSRKHEFGTIDYIYDPYDANSSIEDVFKTIWGCAVCPTPSMFVHEPGDLRSSFSC